MSEDTAMGMPFLYLGICDEIRRFSYIHFDTYNILYVGRNSIRNLLKAFLALYQQTSGDGSPRFAFV